MHGHNRYNLLTSQTALTRRCHGARLVDLADELDLARSTVHAHLQTLRKERYIVKEKSEYHLGLKFFEVGEYTVARKNIYQIAERAVEELADRSNMVADFTVEEHGRANSLFSELYHTSEHDFLGDRRTFYMHNTAVGKAMLAEFAPERIDAIVERWGLPTETDSSITDREELTIELKTIRDRGYAINDEESIEGLFSLGMAVTAPDGRVSGALSLDNPKYRVNERNHEYLVEELERTRDEIESNIPGSNHSREG